LPKKFERLATKGKLGLIGIRERISCINGTFGIYSSLGAGTRLEIGVNFLTSNNEPKGDILSKEIARNT